MYRFSYFLSSTKSHLDSTVKCGNSSVIEADSALIVLLIIYISSPDRNLASSDRKLTSIKYIEQMENAILVSLLVNLRIISICEYSSIYPGQSNST